MSSCTKVKLNPAIDMHRRSMNEDRGWGITAERTKVKIVDALVHGPQFTLVIDLDGLEDQRSRLD
jgi:hypothetical protein